MTNVGQKIASKKAPWDEAHMKWLCQVKPGDMVYVKLDIPAVSFEAYRFGVPVLVLVNPFNEDYPTNDTTSKERAKTLDLVYREQVLVLIGEKSLPISHWKLGPK